MRLKLNVGLTYNINGKEQRFRCVDLSSVFKSGWLRKIALADEVIDITNGVYLKNRFSDTTIVPDSILQEFKQLSATKYQDIMSEVV